MSAVGTAESRAGPKLPRAVYLFGATSLANDLASEMIYPLLPAFVTRTLGGGALTLGILDGLADAVAAALKLVSGYLGERALLRAPLVVGGYAIAAATRPLIAVAGAAWHVIGLRTADRVGKGLRTAPRDLLIADVAPPEARGRAFGLHRAADHTGAIMGPLVSAALIAGGLGVRTVFWIAAVPGALAVALAWRAVQAAGMRRADLRSAAEPSDADRHPARDDRRPPDEGHRPDDALPRRVAGEGDGAELVPLIGVLAAAAFLRAPETLLILRAQDLGIGVAAVPILWAGLHVVRSGSSYPGGVLADRWGARRTLAVGWLAYAGLAVAFALAESRLHAWAIFLAFGLVAGLTESPERKLVAALAPETKRGRGFGWYHGTLSAVTLPGAALFGWLYQARGAEVALGASAAATLLALLLLAVSRDRRRS